MMHTRNVVLAAALLLFISACDKAAPPAPVSNVSDTQASAAASAPESKAVAPAADTTYQASLQDGIAFNKAGYPTFIKEVKGMSALEPTGRWTDGPSVIFSFAEPLSGKVHLEIAAIPYGENAGKKVQFMLGGVQKNMVFDGKANGFQTVSADFDLQKKADTLEIRIPQPTVPPGGDRQLGLFISTLKFK